MRRVMIAGLAAVGGGARPHRAHDVALAAQRDLGAGHRHRHRRGSRSRCRRSSRPVGSMPAAARHGPADRKLRHRQTSSSFRCSPGSRARTGGGGRGDRRSRRRRDHSDRADVHAGAAPGPRPPPVRGRRAPTPSIPAGNPFATPFRVLRAAASVRDFWLLAGTFFVCGWTTNGAVQSHFIPAAHDHAIPEVTAAGLLAVIGVSTSLAALRRAG